MRTEEENIIWFDYQNEDGSISYHKCYSDGNVTYPLGVERNGIFTPTKTSKPFKDIKVEYYTREPK